MVLSNKGDILVGKTASYCLPLFVSTFLVIYEVYTDMSRFKVALGITIVILLAMFFAIPALLHFLTKYNVLN